jgi:hypothetical protein
MRVLVVGEGKHEEAALRILVSRTNTKISDCDFDQISSPAVQTHRGKGEGFFKRAVAWVRAAQRRGYEALVLLIDEDGKSERRKQVDDAQAEMDVTASFPRAMGIAIRSFDAWMLADEKALSQVLGSTINKQPDPEANTDPKSTCATLLDGSRRSLTQSEMYRGIAACVQLDQLEQHCPKGFGVFAARLRAL